MSLPRTERRGIGLNLVARWSMVGLTCMATLFTGVECHPIGSTSGELQTTAACSGPEYRQFDFWVGDWDAFEAANLKTMVARTRVDLILDGCVLREDYEGANGLSGQSFSIYDASRKVWHQSWVTNRGKLLVIEGKFRNGEMVLSGVEHTTDGKAKQVRGTWKAVAEGVRETAFVSTNEGKDWEPWFDLVFRTHKE
jgi:hypothetical protein